LEVTARHPRGVKPSPHAHCAVHPSAFQGANVTVSFVFADT
jgi:hypothetical protein